MNEALLKKHFPWLLVALLLILVAGLGQRHPWSPDEPRFTLIARDMVQTGEYLIPHRGGEAYPDKPQIFMWFIAFFIKILGGYSLAFFLPNLLATLGSLALFAHLLVLFKQKKHLPLLIIISGLCIQVVAQTRIAQIDALLSFWVHLSLYGIIRFYFLQGHFIFYLLSWLAMALGVLTKGVGFLPLFIFPPILYLLLKKETFLKKRAKWHYGWGPLFFLGVLFLWFLTLRDYVNILNLEHYREYFSNILFKQTYQRYLTPWHHFKPFYYYFVSVIPGLWFPLYFFVFFGRREFKKKLMTPLGFSLGLWILLTLAFFHLSSGKRGVYLYPCVFPLAFLLASLESTYLKNTNFQRIWRGLSFLITTVFLLLSLLFFIRPFLLSQGYLSGHPIIEDLIANFPALAIFIVTSMMVGVIFFLRKQPSLFSFYYIVALSWSFLGFIIYPQIDSLRSPWRIMKDIGEKTQNAPLLITSFKETLLLHSHNQPTYHFGFHHNHKLQADAAYRWLDTPGKYLLTTQEDAARCFHLPPETSVGRIHRKERFLLNLTHKKKKCAFVSPSPHEKVIRFTSGIPYYRLPKKEKGP